MTVDMQRNADVRAHFEDEPTPGEAAGLHLLSGLRDGAWLDGMAFPPLRYHLPRIVPEGLTLLVGPPKCGKSWLILLVALAAAMGGAALGQHLDPRPVLMLALEDGPRRLQDRCRTLLGTEQAIPKGFDFLTMVEPGMTLETIGQWLDLHRDEQPLLFLDTLGKVMPPALLGESSYQRDYRVGGRLKRLVDDHPGAGLVVNHHDRKAGSEDFVDAVSGTNGLAGSADTIIVLARRRHETSATLNVTGRDVVEGEYALQFGSACTWQLDGATLDAAAAKARELRQTDGLGERASSVVQFVNSHPEGVTTKHVAAGLDLDDKTASAYLSRAVAQDRIDRPARGLYTPVGSVGSVGTADPGSSTSNGSNTPTAGVEP